MVVNTGKKKIAQLGLSFKAGTDDLRESPQVQLIKRLMGEGLEVQVWMEDVISGAAGWFESPVHRRGDPAYRIGPVGRPEGVLRTAEVVILGNKSASKEQLAKYLRPGRS